MLQHVIVAVIVVVAVVWLIRRTVKSFKGEGCGCAGGCEGGKTCCDISPDVNG
jgi:hypothetical protein